MALKEADLKTIATYKKAVRGDVTKITDTSAIKFWVYKDIELPDDHGKKQKIPAFVALVEDTGIRNFMRGKKLLCSGTCRLEGGKVEFQPLKGKVPFSKLKVTAPLYLGKPLHLPAGAELDEDEETEVEGEEPTDAVSTAPPSPQAPVQTAPPEPNLGAEWTELFKQCQAAVAANPARKDALQHAAAGIPDLIKANNVKDATAKMEALKALLQAPPPAPPGGNLPAIWADLLKQCQSAVAANPARKEPLQHAAAGIPDLIKSNPAEAKKKMDALAALLQAPPTPPPSAGGNLAATWNDLLKQCQAAVAADPTRKEPLQHAAAGIPELIKSNPAEAKKRLDALAALLASHPAPSHDEHAAKAFEQRYDAIEKRYLEALKDPFVDGGPLRGAIAVAKEKGEAGDFAAAEKALDRLESLLETGSQPGNSGRGTPYKGIVEYRRSLLEFDQARKTVDAQVAALARAIADIAPDHEDLADDVEERLSSLNEEIGDAVDDAMSLAENEESPVTEAVKASIKKYLNELAASQLVKRADSNPFGVNVSIEKTLGAALQRVQHSLPVPA